MPLKDTEHLDQNDGSLARFGVMPILTVSGSDSALNSAVNLLRFRFAIGDSFQVRLLLYHNLGLGGGPNFRWQYKDMFSNLAYLIVFKILVDIKNIMEYNNAKRNSRKLFSFTF